MWEAKKTISDAHQIAAQKRLNWVVGKLIADGERVFNGMKFFKPMFGGGLEVTSDKHGVLYRTSVDDEGNHSIVIFHPGPWVDAALAEAQKLEDADNKKLAVNFTPIDC